jgi:Glycosyl hydrolases family 32 N-terminal domain
MVAGTTGAVTPSVPPAYVPPEGWLWDPWFHVEGDTVHLFHLLQQGDRGALTVRDAPVIAHATWSAATDWVRQPLAITPTGAWYDAQRIHTGCIVETSGGYAMLYSASNTYVALAHSDDLVHWAKAPDNPVAQPAPGLYLPHWRDPWVLEQGVGDRFTMVVAAQQPGPHDEPLAAIAVAHSDDLVAWRQDRPLATPPWFEWMEVPELHLHAGRWILLFVTRRKWVTPAGLTALAALGLDPQDGAYCLTADDWHGPYGDLRYLSRTEPPGYTTRLVRPSASTTWLWSHVETETADGERFFLAPPRAVDLDELVA